MLGDFIRYFKIGKRLFENVSAVLCTLLFQITLLKTFGDKDKTTSKFQNRLVAAQNIENIFVLIILSINEDLQFFDFIVLKNQRIIGTDRCFTRNCSTLWRRNFLS